MHKLIVVVALAMALTSCSSDDGGTTGGFGTVDPETRAACYNVTGGRAWTEPLGNGSALTLNPDCSFVITTPDGNAHGRYNSLDASTIQLEATVSSGKYKGCGYQMVATHNNGHMTSMDMWSNDDARCMN